MSDESVTIRAIPVRIGGVDKPRIELICGTHEECAKAANLGIFLRTIEVTFRLLPEGDA